MGGTTLRDFVNSDGKPGYFAQSLLVYGKAGAPCTECNTPLKEIRMNNRSTVYCPDASAEIPQRLTLFNEKPFEIEAI